MRQVANLDSAKRSRASESRVSTADDPPRDTWDLVDDKIAEKWLEQHPEATELVDDSFEPPPFVIHSLLEMQGTIKSVEYCQSTIYVGTSDGKVTSYNIRPRRSREDRLLSRQNSDAMSDYSVSSLGSMRDAFDSLPQDRASSVGLDSRASTPGVSRRSMMSSAGSVSGESERDEDRERNRRRKPFSIAKIASKSVGSHFNNAVVKLKAIPQLGVVLALSGTKVTMHDWKTLQAMTSQPIAKAVLSFAVGSWEEESGTTYRLCVLTKKKLSLLYFDGMKFVFYKDLALSTPAHGVVWMKHLLIVSSVKGYSGYDDREGSAREIFSTDRSGSIALPLPHQSIVFVDHVEGVMKDSNGRATGNRIGWSTPPLALECCFPYVVGLLPRSVEVHDTNSNQALPMTIPCPDPGLHLSACNGRLLVIATLSKLFILRPVKEPYLADDFVMRGYQRTKDVSVIRSHLSEVLRAENHAIGVFLKSVLVTTSSFCARNSKDAEKCILEVQSVLSCMSDIIESYFWEVLLENEKEPSGFEVAHQVLSEAVMQGLFVSLMQAIKYENREEDQKFSSKLQEAKDIHPFHLGIREELWLEGATELKKGDALFQNPVLIEGKLQFVGCLNPAVEVERLVVGAPCSLQFDNRTMTLTVGDATTSVGISETKLNYNEEVGTISFVVTSHLYILSFPPEIMHRFVPALKAAYHLAKKEKESSRTAQSSEPYSSAIDVFRRISTLQTPTSKINCVRLTCEAIIECVKAFHEDLVIGADDLLPLFAYVVVKANVLQLFAERHFIESMWNWSSSSNTLLTGESGYYFATFQTALEIVMQLEPSVLEQLPPTADSPGGSPLNSSILGSGSRSLSLSMTQSHQEILLQMERKLRITKLDLDQHVQGMIHKMKSLTQRLGDSSSSSLTLPTARRPSISAAQPSLQALQESATEGSADAPEEAQSVSPSPSPSPSVSPSPIPSPYPARTPSPSPALSLTPTPGQVLSSDLSPHQNPSPVATVNTSTGTTPNPVGSTALLSPNPVVERGGASPSTPLSGDTSDDVDRRAQSLPPQTVQPSTLGVPKASLTPQHGQTVLPSPRLSLDLTAQFGIPRNEVVKKRFSCANQPFMRGWLYITDSFVCFDTLPIFPKNNKIVMSITSIAILKKARHTNWVDNSLEVTLADGTVHIFINFLHRDDAFDEILLQSKKLNHEISV